MKFFRKKETILLPLNRQFTIVLIAFALISTLIILYSTYDYMTLQTEILDESLQSYSAQLAKSTRQSYESFENICYSIAYNQTIHNYLKSTSSSDRYEYYLPIQNLLTNTAQLNSDIYDIAVYGINGNFASLTGASSAYESFAKNLPASRFPFQGAGITEINQVPCHILAMPIYSLGTGESKYLGVMFLAADITALFENSLYTEGTYDPHILFTNGETLIFGDPALYEEFKEKDLQEERFQIQLSSIDYSITRYSIPSIDYTLYVMIDLGATKKLIAGITLKLFLLLSALIAFLLLILFFLYRPLISSLHKLTQYMKNISAGDRRIVKDGGPTIHQGMIGSSEIDDIFQAFRDMLLETDRLNHTIFDTYTRMYELENNNRKTEIAFLRSQVNPHFLYNTLTMICGMAAEGNTDKIITVTNALSQIFRYSIKGSEMVTLREEMEIVRSYLMIQALRFEDRFTIKYNFSQDSHDCLIPKMVIQPLVENAIVHGLEKSLRPGSLLIGAGRNPQHGYLAIWIYDTGVGMPIAKLEELRESMNQTTNYTNEEGEHHNSIGLLNVNSRMVLYYGQDYKLIIDSEENVGTNIQIRIPYHQKGDT